MSSLLTAIKNIVENPVTDIISYYQGSNRINNMGYALEEYIKDSFCNSFSKSIIQKNSLYSKNFSYLGNQNNPPDIIIKKGDAIEVKKIESLNSSIALNSSYPKDKLYCNDPRITNFCKNSDGGKWKEKDIIYVVGVAPKSKLKAVWFVYGDCYAANRQIYKRIKNKMSKGIREIPNVELIKTNEIAKVNKVDPLGITDLRVRGMWNIQNPKKVFSDYCENFNKFDFSLHVILLESKYLSFKKSDRNKIEKISKVNFKIKNIKIKSPNNPAKLLKAKYIYYVK